MMYDVIVIGSGVSGMATASALAKRGYKVLILEQHYTAGGATHTFKRRDFEWDIGVHYVGEMGKKDGFLRRSFDSLTDGKLDWAAMDNSYDRVRYGGEEFGIVAGPEAYKESLIAKFPHEARNIESYLQYLRGFGKISLQFLQTKFMPPLAKKAMLYTNGRELKRHLSSTTKHILSQRFKDESLMGLLTAQWGAYGLPPHVSASFSHHMVSRHYLHGGYYPVGGGGEIANTMLKVIRNYGGDIRLRASVREVVIKNKMAMGVVLSSGEEIRSRFVISSIGAANTFNRLVAKETGLLVPISKDLANLRPSTSNVCLYLGFNTDIRQLGVANANYYVFPSLDHQNNWDAFHSDLCREFPMVYISFPSNKDPAWQAAHGNTSTAEVMAFVPYALAKTWEHTPYGKRDKAYLAWKNEMKSRLMATFERQFPQLGQHVVCSEFSTPLSLKHFGQYEEGATYGLAHTPDRFTSDLLMPKTLIKNLYLTGQDVTTDGVGTAMIAGLITASRVSGTNILMEMMRR